MQNPGNPLTKFAEMFVEEFVRVVSIWRILRSFGVANVHGSLASVPFARDLQREEMSFVNVMSFQGGHFGRVLRLEQGAQLLQPSHGRRRSDRGRSQGTSYVLACCFL